MISTGRASCYGTAKYPNLRSILSDAVTTEAAAPAAQAFKAAEMIIN